MMIGINNRIWNDRGASLAREVHTRFNRAFPPKLLFYRKGSRFQSMN
jgi:hypothetical protein